MLSQISDLVWEAKQWSHPVSETQEKLGELEDALLRDGLVVANNGSPTVINKGENGNE